MRKYLAKCLLPLVVALAALPADAQPNVERRYLVEVIIFKNTGPDSSDGELWDQGFVLPPTTPDGLAEPPAPDYVYDAPAGAAELPRLPEQPVIHGKELVHMIDILSKLESSQRYEVLVRHAWTQPMRDKSNAIPVPVGLNPALTADAAMLYAPPTPVAGTVKMFEQRLLFIEADVTARMATALANDPGSLVSPVDIEYRIKETRRVKLNEVHYFDHPYFGLLVRVSRAEPVELQPQPPLTDEAAPGASTQVPPAAAPPN